MKPLATAVGIAIVIAAIAISSVFFLRSCTSIPVDETSKGANKAVDLGKRIFDGLGRRLNIQPEIKIDRETEIEFNRAVLHLTTLKRDFTHEEIIQFETMINNHIIVEEDFVRMLPEMIEEASNTLSDEKENTHAIDVANENLQHQEGGSQTARDAKIAQEELAAQEAVYKAAVEAFLNGKV